MVGYRSAMRWQPDRPVCAECGFDWDIARQREIDLVAQLPGTAAAAVNRVPDPMQRTGARWSASMYVWHLVDVLRIGTERLLTLTHDPDQGIPCWGENAPAEDHRYQQSICRPPMSTRPAPRRKPGLALRVSRSG